jgi:O-antigen ligase
MLDTLKETLNERSTLEKTIWILILLFIFSISFSIAASQIFLSALALCYLYRKLTRDRQFPWFSLMLPALAFSYFSLLSVAFSIHPSQSLVNAKNLSLFIILPILYDALRDLNDVRIVYRILIIAGVISASYGLFQFFNAWDNDLSNIRIKGFMGHWMTFSGLLMILNVLLFSHLLFSPQKPLWFYPAFGIISVALILSLTRNVWLGSLAAFTVLIAMRKVRWIIAIPVVVFIVVIASQLLFPVIVINRMHNIFNPNETSSRDRIQMLRSGWKIIKDYPLTGVGGDMIQYVYPRYREPDSPFRNNQHLHNNLVQLAAENGIPALIAWLWLIMKVISDLISWKRNVMNPEERFMIHGTIGVVVALLVAGMFEYNYGDSEIKMLFLVLITLPYGWHKTIQNAERETGVIRGSLTTTNTRIQ